MTRPVRVDDAAPVPRSIEQRITTLERLLQGYLNVGGDLTGTLPNPSVAAPTAIEVNATGTLTVTNVTQPIPGLSITVPVAGTYFAAFVVDFQSTATGYIFGLAVLWKGVAQQGGDIVFGDNGAANQRSTIGQNAIFSCVAGDVLSVQAVKAVAGGALTANTVNSSLNIFRIR